MEVRPLLVQYEIRYSVLEVANEGGGRGGQQQTRVTFGWIRYRMSVTF